MARFDRVIVVDWSAAGKPSPIRPSADAIWIGDVSAEGEIVTYHAPDMKPRSACGPV
ncbi:MAG: hypothetical protein HC844_17115 [Tabrizicola sp.]|nr:hypothetical protein [Tabrizicola sp.]